MTQQNKQNFADNEMLFPQEAVRAEIYARKNAKADTKPKKSLLGICKNLGKAPSNEDIEEMRQEIWSNFAEDDR